MNESEWADLADPVTMLDYIQGPQSSLKRPVVATERQLLLWASACCRRIGHLFDDIRCINAVLAAERFADGELTYKELLAVGEQTRKWQTETFDEASNESAGAYVARACAHLVEGVDSAFDGMDTPFLPPVEDATRWAVAAIQENAGLAAGKREKVTQCSILHDILGNPFRPVHCREEWRTCSVVALANEIYNQRWFGRLPELEKALIEAVCDNNVILNHCRSDEPHVRGCWVVDLFLQRQFRLQWS